MEASVSPSLTVVARLGNLVSFRYAENPWCGVGMVRCGTLGKYLPGPKGLKRTHESHCSGQNQRARRGIVEEIRAEHRADHQRDDWSGIGRCGRANCEKRDARDTRAAGQGTEIACGGSRGRGSGQY